MIDDAKKWQGMRSWVATKRTSALGACFAVLFMLSASLPAVAADARQVKPAGPYASPTPKYLFATTLEEQQAQLKSNALMQRFARSRQALASDRYRPAYHFVSPESLLNDPNGLVYWQGRWHLFYQAYPPDEFPDEKDRSKRRQHWGHAVSDDLIHWRDLPYAIYPGIERMVFSGSTVAEEDRVVAFYPGIDAPGPSWSLHPDQTIGQMVAVSRDPLLLNWEKSGPLKTDAGDSDIWKEGDTFFGLVGGTQKYYPDAPVPLLSEGFRNRMYGLAVWPKNSLWKSKDLAAWEPAGELLFEPTPFTDRFDDGSCPNFEPIGDKHILLYFSHTYGGKYLLGDYDERAHRFRPYDSGRFNHGQVLPAGVHAPSAASDGRGAVINILNVNAGRATAGWDQMLSLPQRLSLGEDKRLRIEPVPAVVSLRGTHRRAEQTRLPAGEEIVLSGIQGNAMELQVDLDPGAARSVELNVLRSPQAEEQTSITFYNLRASPIGPYLDGGLTEQIVLDGSRSSTLPDVWARAPEKAPVQRGNERLRLRVFIDRSIVEVFVNERQYLAMRVYPGREDSLGVSLRAHGQDAILKSLDAWQMKPIWPVADAAPLAPKLPAASADLLPGVPDADGMVHVPSFLLPESSLLDDATHAALKDGRDKQKAADPFARRCPNIEGADRVRMREKRMCEAEAFYKLPSYQKFRAQYPVTVTSQTISGVHTEVFAPADGIAERNARRVLINLHAGGFLGGSLTASHFESVPLASLGKIKVISIDYRLAPEYRFPSASEDAEAVYRELLKTYEPQNIGIYGASAGGLLTAQVVAWLRWKQLPPPGAVGMFFGAADWWGAGDSGRFAAAKWQNPVNLDSRANAYLEDVDVNDTIAFPGRSEQILARFPPSLLISSTQDISLSSVVNTHSQLVAQGVPAELRVWEGLEHLFFYNFELRQARDAYAVIVRFFDRTLGAPALHSSTGFDSTPANNRINSREP